MERRSRRSVLGAALTGAAALGLGGTVWARRGWDDDLVAVTSREATRLERPTGRRWTPRVIGESVEGRPIVLHRNLTDDVRATVLVISALHGDERGTAHAALDMITATVPAGVNALVVPIANPDGWHRGTRENANGVDLNRNFPFWWQPADGGPAPASEPETRVLMELVTRVSAAVTVWLHQPYEYVAPVDPGARRFSEAWAAAAGLGHRSTVTQRGGGETWTFHVAGRPSILVEGTSRAASLDEVRAHRRGFEAVLAAV